MRNRPKIFSADLPLLLLTLLNLIHVTKPIVVRFREALSVSLYRLSLSTLFLLLRKSGVSTN